MGRPLRLEFSGALYHVTSRGDRQEDIYESVDDRVMFLEVFGEVCKSYNWVCHGYCLMTNHYHILIETYLQYFPLLDIVLQCKCCYHHL